MNFLHGMMDIIPGNGINAKAIRQLTEESKIFKKKTRKYSGRFELNQTITTTDLYRKEREIDVSYGYIELEYKNHKFYQTIEIWGHCKNGPYAGVQNLCATTSIAWRWNIKRVSEKMFNEEVEKFRQAFLNDHPIVHNEIRAAILISMHKKVCFRCLDEKTEGHACRYPTASRTSAF